MAALLLVLPSIPQGRAQVPAYPSAAVLVEVHESVAYDLYGSSVSKVYGSVNGTMSPINSSTTIHVLSTIQPYSANLTCLLVDGSLTNKSETPTSGTYSLVLPANTTSFQFLINGSTTGVELLWRYLGSVPGIRVTDLGVPTNYTTRIVIPSNAILSQEYGPSGGALPLPNAVSPSSESGYSSYPINPGASLIVLQSNLFLPASVAVTSAALVMIALAALGLFGQGREILQRLKRSLLNFVSILRLSSLRGLRPGFRFRSLFQPRKLLALFLLCALLMASAAAIGGPDPRLKAYVVAQPSSATDNVADIQESLQKVAPNTLVITPAQDYTDFAVMSSVGQFELAVFSSYPSAGIGEIQGYILPSLTNVPVIMVDNSADKTLAGLIETTYSGKVLQVQDAGNLTLGEQRELASLLAASSRTNLFGLNLSVYDFNALMAFEAVLSILLVFIGFCYLGSLASESSSLTDLTHLVSVLGAGIFVFVFSEALYVTVSSMLAFPLSLHAVISGAHYLTAVSLLGFGGGSTPRLAAGFLGVLVGVVGTRGSPPIEKSDLVLVLGIGLFLLANPFSIGQFVFQGLLLFLPLGNLAFGAAYASSLSLKGFIYGVGSALGAGVTPTYLMSAGKMLFFAGLVPLAYLRKMGRTTMIIALLLVALFVGDGGVRIGEMTPDKTVIAILPGLVIGFAFAFLILGLASIEKYVRGVRRSKG